MERMTLLVGMVGSDGIVIGADQLMVELAEDTSGVDNFMHSTKLQLFERQKLVCGYAGDDWASYVGAEVSSLANSGSLPPSEVALLLKSAAESGMRRVYRSVQNPRSLKDARREILVGMYGAEPSLWYVKVDSWEDRTTAEDRHSVKVFQMSGNRVLGAVGNTARYFAHYFRQEMPVSMLINVAALIILAGNSVDGMIDGLDIAVASGGECRLLSRDEKGRLREKAAQIDEFVRTQLFGKAFSRQ